MSTRPTPTNPPGSLPLGLRLRRLRWQLRRALAYGRFGPESLAQAPVIFGNSFPKSGTHLLIQVLDAFPGLGPSVVPGVGPVLTFERTTGRQRTPGEILAELAWLGPGDIGFGHVLAVPETQARLCHSQVAHFFLYRDPRDVVISHAFYVTDRAEDHVHHAFYTQQLASNEERIRASILGRPELGDAFPDIAARFALYEGWLSCPWVCGLRFEDFISHRQGTLARVLAYARERGFELRLPETQALGVLDGAIKPQRSPTFRRGKPGSWRELFTPEHVRLFKDRAGELLIRLGYERDYDW